MAFHFSGVWSRRQWWLVAAAWVVSGGLAWAEAVESWKEVSNADGLKVYERSHPGSNLREYRGTGLVEVPPATIKRVLGDVENFPSFMPYVKEAKLISEAPQARVTYQRISPPVVGDRDYTVATKIEERKFSEGPGYTIRWATANQLGPAEKAGVTRVKTTEGSWILEPTKGGQSTLVTYTVYTDSGGSIPVWMLNTAGKSAVPKIFAAVRKQVRLAKYQQP